MYSLELVQGRRAPVDVTGLSDTFDQFLVPNLRNWGVRLSYYNNFDASSSGSSTVAGINVVLESLFDSTGTSGVTFTIRSTTSVRSAANPEWTGQVQIDGEFQAIAGDVATADKGTVSLKGLASLSRLTSST